MRIPSTITVATMLATAGCGMGPMVSDDPSASVHVLPADGDVPDIATNADLERQIRINDGLNDAALAMSNGLVPLKQGWARGAQVAYWDLGDAAPTSSTLYTFVRPDDDGDGVVPVDHPHLLAALPGDPGYSPILLVQQVVVTDAYQGERLPSIEALLDAAELGLIEEPTPLAQFVDGPVVPPGTRLDRGPGVAPTETIEVYARGYRVNLLPVGGASAFRTTAKPGRLPRGDVHRIWVGNAINASSQPTFQNDGASWSPTVRVIDCRVKVAETPNVTSESELFKRDMAGNMIAAEDRVMTWTITTTTKNWPIHVPGAP